jgi:hypothetical protein
MQLLQGEFFLRTGQRDRGRETLLKGIAQARAAPGPDEWAMALFTLEAVSNAARESDDWEFAGQITRQMLSHDPSYAGSHYAAGLVAEHNGDRAGARAAFVAASKLWDQADPDLPALVDLKRRLQAPQ